MTSKGMSEMDSIGKRVAAKSCAKNPSVAMEAVALRHQVSELKGGLKLMADGLGSTMRTAVVVTAYLTHQLNTSLAQKADLALQLNTSLSQKERVLMLGEAAVRKLVSCKMAEDPALTEAEALVSVLTDISVDAFGAAWSNEDVTDIRSWCTLPNGGSVMGTLRGEVIRVTAFMPQVAQALAPVAGTVTAGGVEALGEAALGFSRGSKRVLVAVDLDSDGLDSDDEYSSDEGIGVRVAKRRRVFMGESGDEKGCGDGSSGGGSTVETQP